MRAVLSALNPFALALLSVALFLSIPLAHADELPQPTGKVLLTVEGRISNTTDGSVAIFDRRQLESLGMHRLETSNPFVEGVHTYEGPLLSALLDRVGAEGQLIRARALDGYVVDIPLEDARAYPVILAMIKDGQVMRVRTKGPLWIIYPVDQFEKLQAERFSGRSIWQLTHLTVE